jgi:aminopeptidase YwaD
MIFDSDDRKAIFEISAGRIYEYIRKLAQFGTKFGGTKSEYSAMQWIRGKFQDFGLDTEIETFRDTLFEEHFSSLAFTKPTEREMSCKALLFSVSTPDEGIQGEVAYVGLGDKDEMQRKGVDGKIILFRRTEGTSDPYGSNARKIVGTATDLGAVGAIFMNCYPRIFVNTLEELAFDPKKRLSILRRNPIPSVAISSTDGEQLIRRCESSHATVRIVTKTTIEERESLNLRAMIPGTSLQEERLLIIGHADSVGGPGAFDNCAGVSANIEVARALSKLQCRRTIEVVVLGSEEATNWAGARAYVKKHENELERIIGVINNDAIGYGSGLYLRKGGVWPERGKLEPPKWFSKQILKVSESLGHNVIPRGPRGTLTGDEGRFLDAGVPAVWFIQLDRPTQTNPYLHGPEDIPEHVDPNAVKVVADICAVSAMKFANKQEPPSARREHS